MFIRYECFTELNVNTIEQHTEVFSTLTSARIKKGCQHTYKIWKTFNSETLGEYHDLFVEADVLLLADVFQDFRKLCIMILITSIILLHILSRGKYT